MAASGPQAEVLTQDRIRAVYGIGAQVLAHPVTGGPLIAPAPDGLPLGP